MFSRILSKLAALPAPTIRAVCERDLHVPMRDGVTLLADRWYPSSGPAPTLLVRSPYGRRSIFGLLYGRLFAERGFQVVVQSCRGTFGSGGVFEPLVREASDARDTIEWMRGQAWFTGAYATIGASYLCFAQWAAARSRAVEHRAMIAQAGPHEFLATIHPGGAFALDAALSFASQVTGRQWPGALVMVRHAFARRKMRIAFRELPLASSCERALGRRVAFLEDWMAHAEPGDSFWNAMDHREAVASIEAPVLLQSGWYDLFASYATSQYEALRRRGQRPFLTIGPWTHAEFPLKATRALLPETLAWLRAHLLGDRDGLRSAPVRVFVLNTDRWREYDDWPPPQSAEQTWYLHPEGRLSREPAPASDPDRYRYDPTDPTPAVGGGMILFGAGPRDNRSLEARGDVLTYTTAPFVEETTVVGSPTVRLYVRSTLRSTDFFARLCNVHPDGRSINVCDALIRLRPGDEAWQADGSARVSLRLSPTACCFHRGHRLRLQISGGAHPRFARNTGTGEPLATGTGMMSAEQSVFHDSDRPSSLELRYVR